MNRWIFFLFGLVLVGVVSADIVSINSGGDNQLIINSGGDVEGFFFNFNLRPLMNNVILFSTYGTNFTTENLSVSHDSSDPDLDVITNISDWRVDGDSIAVLNYPFDSYKVQGEIRDYSSYENNGALGGGNNDYIPEWRNDCQVGGCYEFDGVDDYVDCGNRDSLNIIETITLEAWVNPISYSQHYPIFIRKGDNYRIGLRGVGDGRVYFRLILNGITRSLGSSSNVGIGEWTHVVGTYDGSYMTIYINGEVDGTPVAYTGSIDSTTLSLIVGAYNSLGSYSFNGSIDEVKIYSRALSSEQVKLNYNSGLAGHSMEELVAQETDKGDVWKVAMTSNDAFYDSETVLSNELTIVNDAPLDPEPILVSLDGSNESDVDLNCSSFIYDEDSDILNVTVRWYLDDILNLSFDFGPYLNGSLFYSILNRDNLTLGDIWKCEVGVYDGFDNSNWVESNDLTIIDINEPLVYIISPEQKNYSELNISFNVSIVENENVSMCFYDLDSEGNVTMNELNESYFWDEPTLGPGEHEVWFYCNDTSNNWGSNYTNFTIDNEAAIAILLSPLLLQQVRWDVLSLPIDDFDAVGNNLNGTTDYFVNISATNTLVDLYVRADGDLFNFGGDVIGLGNETFRISVNNLYVNDSAFLIMSTNYVLIGDSLESNSTVFLKFYLDAPASQAAGEYLNQLDFKAVRDEQSP